MVSKADEIKIPIKILDFREQPCTGHERTGCNGLIHHVFNYRVKCASVTP